MPAAVCLTLVFCCCGRGFIGTRSVFLIYILLLGSWDW